MGLRLIWRKLKAIRNGKADGKRGIPTVDQTEFPLYEMQLTSVYQSTIEEISKKYLEKDRPLKEEYCRALEQIDNITNRIEELEPGYKESLKNITEKKTELQGVIHQVHTVRKSYWALFTFLAICEFPINSIVFDVLGEAKWLTYIYAATLGVAIPFGAHFVGILFRRESPFKSGTAALKTATIFGIVIAVLLGIAYLREKFVEGAGVTEFLGIQLDPRMITILFLSINILIFTIAIIASYFAHIDVADAEIKKLASAKKALDALEYKEADLERKGAHLEHLKTLRDQLEERIAKIRQARLILLQAFKEAADGYVETCRWAISVYRNSNMRARAKKGSPEMPRCFAGENYPELTLAPLDEELDEDCGQGV